MVHNLEMLISGTIQNVNIVHTYFKNILINHIVSIFSCFADLCTECIFIDTSS